MTTSTAPKTTNSVFRSAFGTLTDLRLALGLDAVVTGLNGLAYLAAGSLLDDLLGVPSGALRVVGGFLLAYAIIVWLIRTPARISRRQAYGVVIANAVWFLASLGVATSGWHSPTVVGTMWIVAQACVVAGFAELQFIALRRAPAGS